MIGRITTDQINRNLLDSLNQTQQIQNNALSALETQRSVNVPSDNPAAAALYSVNLAANSQATQFLQNINSVTGGLQVADSALGSAVSLLNQAVTVGTSGATGTASASDRQALAQQVGVMQQQMMGIANSTYQGAYIFAGAGSGPAFTASTTQPDGVQYQGDTNVNQVEIAPGVQTAVNVPGSQIFQNSGGSVFQALQDLKTALTANNPAGAQTAVTELNGALSQLSQQRVFYGSTLNQLSANQSYLTSEQQSLAQQQTNLVGADLATSISQLSTAEVARNAILTAGGRLTQNSLLNVPGAVG